MVAHARREVRRRGEVRRPANDQRCKEPIFVTKLLPAGVRLAIVPEENDDRVVFEALCPQCVKHCTDLSIQFRRRVQVVCPILPHDRMIRVERRQLDLRRSCSPGGVERPVCLIKIDLCVERLMRF